TSLFASEPAPNSKWLLGLVAAFAVLPGADSVVARLFGINAAIGLTLLLALLGLRDVLRQKLWPQLNVPSAATLAFWFAIVAAELIDIDWRGQLRQSVLVFDLVKHAATVSAIDTSGAPPVDPFFLRASRSGYYYFFYTLPGLLSHLLHGL